MLRQRRKAEGGGRKGMRRGRVLSCFFVAFCLLSALRLPPSAFCAEGAPLAPLRFDRDTFGFANETYYVYPHGYAEKRQLKPGEKPPAFTLRCFAMCRSEEQFHKFARFDPTLPRPDDATLNALVRRVNRHAVWRAALPPEQRVVIPGYPDLRALSEAHPLIMQKNVGGGLVTYLRVGNWRMFWFWWNGPSEQACAQREVESTLARNDLYIAYLTTYPSLSVNHAVLFYGKRPGTPAETTAGIIHYLTYDPNHPDAPRDMVWDPRIRQFSYQKDWDFVGGKVTVLRAYRFWLQ